ncbi:hypothetical protein CHS0354_027358 [Potamilus streckersoni]|uniref:Large ribosomal subunit protein uL23c n=1 Tax=Potamilus streckersoni TaxID=2493646 RepID=A0AAE0SQI9_9BIVA|nr:hypothetical protein CHS0354_027358 [Potamilus streckersoni]
MGNIKKYQADGKEVGTIELADDILNTPYHPFLIKNLLTAYLAGQRQGTHKTKGRSEVAGSTRKLYKQKGTGNARAGSIRSPLRRHGGTLFGPVPRDYDKKVNKKERKLALKSALAQLVREDKIAVVSDFSLSTHKTKDYAKALSAWNARSFLLVHDDPDENCIRVIVKPLLNEKLNQLRVESNKVIFKVHPDANKFEIKSAVQKFFAVKVLDVNTINVKGKPKRRGIYVGKTADWKKAVVTLEKDSKIEYFEGV